MYLKSYHEKDIIQVPVGTKFNTYTYMNSWRTGAEYTIKEFLPNGVKCYNNWKKKDEILPYGITVQINFTEEELHQRDFNMAKEIALAMKHKLYDEGDAVHEMWNGWITCNPYEMAKTAKEEDLTVIGWFTLTAWKKRDLDIGIVAEYPNGDRIWCHAASRWFANWEKWYPELYEE